MSLQDDFDKETDLASDFDNEQDLSVRTPAQAPEAEGGVLETAGDTIRGAAQGVTFGLADELAGGLGAAGEVLTGQTELQNALEAYRRQRDESRAAYKAAEERSPTAFTTGNILGGIATAIPTAGIGAAAKGAGLLARLGSAAKIGGAAGGIAGLGTSEADLTKGDIGGVAADVASGIGTGAVFGVGTQGGMELVKGGAALGKGVAKALGETDTVSNIRKALKLGTEGTDLVTEKGLEAAEQAVRGESRNLASEARAVLKKAGAKVGQAKKGASKTTFNLEEEINAVKETIEDLKTSDNPEAIKDVNLLQDYLDNLLLGKVAKVPVEFSRLTPAQKVPATPSAKMKLESEAQKLAEQSRLQGENARFNIQESPDGKFLSLVKTTDEQIGAPERAIAVLDSEGNPTGQYDLFPGESEKAFKSGVKVKTVENVPGTPETVIPAQRGELVSGTTEIRRGGADPTNVTFKKASDIKRTLNDFTGASGGTPKLGSQDAINQLKQQAKSISDKMGQATPELASANQEYAAVSQSLKNLGLNPAKDFITDAATGKQRLTLEAEQKINNVIKRMARDTDAGENAAVKLNEALRLLEVADPAKAAALKPRLEKASEVLDLAQKAQRLGLLNRSTYLKSGTINVANRIGLGAKKLSEATPDELKQVVNAAMTKGGASMKIVQPLMDAMKKDNVGRNAALFSLQQNPEYREILKDLVSSEEE